MTNDQFNDALQKLGFTTPHPLTGVPSKGQSEFAVIADVDVRTVRRWASGESEVPVLVAMLLNLMLKTKTKPEKLKS